jgi:hypothetical protein
MSSTLFRLYRVIGGDAVGLNGNLNLARRREAADYVAYLIMWAIGLLHLGSVAPSTPGILATALMEADALTGLFTYGGQTRQGGALAKIIRWAFEQQGYYWPLGAAWPRNGPGAPPAVDVFLEDEAGRGGGYEFTDRWQARSDAVRVQPRGGNPAQDGAPQRGQPNLVHVTVRNRGTSAGAVTARAWAASGAAVDIWEDNAALWTPLRLQNAAVSTPQVPVPPGQAVEVGAFEWTPLAAGRHTVMVSIDAPGDRSPLHPPIILACATGPTPVAQLVPFDNNLGYRTWVIA